MVGREAFEIIDTDGEASISFMVGRDHCIDVGIELWGINKGSTSAVDASGYSRTIRRMVMSESECNELIKRLRKYL